MKYWCAFLTMAIALVVGMPLWADNIEVIHSAYEPIEITMPQARSGGDWIPQNPLITGNFYGVWAKSLNERFVVGDGGQILWYRYGTWTLIQTNSINTYYAVHGTAAGKIYMVGTDGTNGLVTSYDPTTGVGTDEIVDTTATVFYGVYAFDANNVYVVGTDGAADAGCRWDGTIWDDTWDPNVGAGATLYSVYTFDGAMIYVVGTTGATGFMCTWDIAGFWINNVTNIPATVGTFYGIFLWDGSNAEIVGGSTGDVAPVWYRVPDIGVATPTWNAVTMPNTSSITKDNYVLRGVWGAGTTSDNVMYAPCFFPAGGDISSAMKVTTVTGTATATFLRFDDNESFQGVSGWQTGGVIDETYLVGNNTRMKRGTSTGWAWIHRTFSDKLNDVWGIGRIAYAVGEEGAIFKYDGSRWSQMVPATSEDLYAVWGTAENNVFVVGTGGTILKYDGSKWTIMSSTTTEGLYAIWGSAATNIWVVGANGTVLNFNGTAWAQKNPGNIPTVDLFGVWGAGTVVYAVGEPYITTDPLTGSPITKNGVWRWDGTKWVAVETLLSGSGYNPTTLRGVWFTSSTDVYIIGDEATTGTAYNMLNYNGATSTYWTPRRVGTGANDINLAGVFWGVPGTGAFVVGNEYTAGGAFVNSHIYHFDNLGNATFEEQSNPRSFVELWGVWGNAGRDVFTVGDDGNVLHYAYGSYRMDFDRNGKSDIVLRRNSGSDVTNPTGTLRLWTMHDNAVVKDASWGVDANTLYPGVGDFDNNGHADLISESAGNIGNIWFSGPGGTISSSNTIAGTGDILALGYFDTDNKSDILWRNGTTLTQWYMDGSVQIGSAVVDTVAPTATGACFVCTLDGNSSNDILWPDISGAELVWFMDRHQVTLQLTIAKPTGTGWVVKAVGDFDGNGGSDIMWVNAANAVNIGFVMIGQGQPTILPVSTVAPAGSTIAAVGDFNGDGKDDILWRTTATGALTLWKMSGQIVTSAAIAAPTTSGFIYSMAQWSVVSK